MQRRKKLQFCRVWIRRSFLKWYIVVTIIRMNCWSERSLLKDIFLEILVLKCLTKPTCAQSTNVFLIPQLNPRGKNPIVYKSTEKSYLILQWYSLWISKFLENVFGKNSPYENVTRNFGLRESSLHIFSRDICLKVAVL